MSTTPPPPGGSPPPPGPRGGPPPGFPPPPGAGGAPGGAPAEGGTRSPQDSMTRYDKEKDAYHCSYGIPTAARTVWDPQREMVVRVDLHSPRVIGFSIPNFTEWLKTHGKEDGSFEVDLPEVFPMDQVRGA
jgi:hypothetical protein